MENKQNKPPEGVAASGHGGQKFHTDSEQSKLHKSKLRMENFSFEQFLMQTLIHGSQIVLRSSQNPV